MRSLLSLAALALLAAPLPAAACSVAAGYRVPTNLELVAQADLILLASIEDGATDPRSADAMQVRIRPLAALKGTVPAGSLTLQGAMIGDGMLELSNPYDLERPHPQSMAGACTRYAFARGSRVLFFLKADGGDWVPSAPPFSRWAEDVLSEDAPWVQAVRLYAEIAALPAAEQAKALAAHRDTLRARRADPVARLLAADIDRQLAGPNKPLREVLPPAPDE